MNNKLVNMKKIKPSSSIIIIIIINHSYKSKSNLNRKS